VLIVIEVISALLAPTIELVIPLFVLFAEALFWLFLLVVELIIAVLYWRKPKIPNKPQFFGVRNKLKSFSAAWRKWREDKKLNKKS